MSGGGLRSGVSSSNGGDVVRSHVALFRGRYVRPIGLGPGVVRTGSQVQVRGGGGVKIPIFA